MVRHDDGGILGLVVQEMCVYVGNDLLGSTVYKPAIDRVLFEVTACVLHNTFFTLSGRRNIGC